MEKWTYFFLRLIDRYGVFIFLVLHWCKVNKVIMFLFEIIFYKFIFMISIFLHLVSFSLHLKKKKKKWCTKKFPWLLPIMFVCNKFCSFMSHIPYLIQSVIYHRINNNNSNKAKVKEKSEWKSKTNMFRDSIKVENMFSFMQGRKNILSSISIFIALSFSAYHNQCMIYSFSF